MKRLILFAAFFLLLPGILFAQERSVHYPDYLVRLDMAYWASLLTQEDGYGAYRARALEGLNAALRNFEMDGSQVPGMAQAVDRARNPHRYSEKAPVGDLLSPFKDAIGQRFQAAGMLSYGPLFFDLHREMNRIRLSEETESSNLAPLALSLGVKVRGIMSMTYTPYYSTRQEGMPPEIDLRAQQLLKALEALAKADGSSRAARPKDAASAAFSAYLGVFSLD